MLRDTLSVANGRDDMPIAECKVALGDRECLQPLEMHNSATNRVHRTTV
jgi:hypothetical protein